MNSSWLIFHACLGNLISLFLVLSWVFLCPLPLPCLVTSGEGYLESLNWGYPFRVQKQEFRQSFFSNWVSRSVAVNILVPSSSQFTFYPLPLPCLYDSKSGRCHPPCPESHNWSVTIMMMMIMIMTLTRMSLSLVTGMSKSSQQLAMPHLFPWIQNTTAEPLHGKWQLFLCFTFVVTVPGTYPLFVRRIVWYCSCLKKK